MSAAKLTRVAAALALAGVVLVATPAPAAAASALAYGPGLLHLQIVPALPGVVVKVDGSTAKSNAKGQLSVPVDNFVNLERRLKVPQTQIAPDRRVVFDRFRGELSSGARGKVIEMGVRTSRLVSWRFVDRFGDEVPLERVQSMRVRSSTGEVFDLHGDAVTRPLWVADSRTQQTPRGLLSKPLYYVIDSAVVDGATVVHRAQQRFVPWDQHQWRVQLLFFRVTFTSSDLLFTRRSGAGVELVGPDGVVERLPFGPDGSVWVANLPRGTYQVRVYDGGVSFSRPVSISRDQQVTLNVVSWLDLALIITIVASVAIGLILLGRPVLRGQLRTRGWRLLRRAGAWRPDLTATGPPDRLRSATRTRRPGWARSRRGTALILAAAAATLATVAPARPAAASPPHAPPATAAAPVADPVPVLAYYYIWFNPTSWNRAKIDYPLLGRYSSDDVEIMRRHVRMAKTAGIDGFLVSWKHTPQLDARLASLVEVARAEDFRLGIVYQGLDFQRAPLAITTVAADLDLFADRYGADAVFDVFGKPLVIWTGADLHSRDAIESTLAGVRGRILVLGNAKNVAEVDKMGPVVDGQAYYWSSVDPAATATSAKLAQMADAVHLYGGVWIAPLAPGFDARLVGGSKEVTRRDGDTLRASYAAARAADPDALGMISWNEFSENTHIEPSHKYGTTGLHVLAELLGARVQIDVAADSSGDSLPQHQGLTAFGALLLGGSAALLLPVAVAIRRRRRDAAAGGQPAGGAGPG